MHKTVQNLVNIESEIKLSLSELSVNKIPKIIAVSKTFKIDDILPLIDHGHLNFGENKVQEALDKWMKIKSTNPNIKLHMLGKLQTNKVKFAVKLFDYIHSLDSEKLAKKISEEQQKINKNLKCFIQINIGQENQKTGIDKNNLIEFYNFCKKIDINIVGLMCLPPANSNSTVYFKEMKNLIKKIDLKELSMGMSSDYIEAAINSSSFLRLGTAIFGSRD